MWQIPVSIIHCEKMFQQQEEEKQQVYELASQENNY